MNSVNKPVLIRQPDSEARLRHWWRTAAIFCCMTLLTGFAIVHYYLKPALAWRWLFPSLVIVIYILAFLKSRLRLNHRKNEIYLLPTFGWGNWITLLRGVLISILAGLLLLPWNKLTNDYLWLAWLPGTVYISAALLDYFDGVLARIFNQQTRLGESFDTQMDALGLLVAILLAIKIGQLPLSCITAGLAYYLFQIGIQIRKKLSKVVIDLKPRPEARFMAGLYMGFVGLSLFPILRPPVTDIAAVIFLVPFLLGFLQDWWIVCDKLETNHRPQATWQKKLHRLFAGWMPLFLRLSIVMAAVMHTCQAISAASESTGKLWHYLLHGSDSKINIIFMILLVPLALGISGRLFAAVIGFSAGYLITHGQVAAEFYLIYTCALCLVLTGSGRLSLWKPQEKITRGDRYGDSYLIDCSYSP